MTAPDTRQRPASAEPGTVKSFEAGQREDTSDVGRVAGPAPLRSSLAAVVDRLTVEQLEHLLAIKRARQDAEGPTLADEEARLAAQADPATAAALVALRRERDDLGRIADLWRTIGIDDDLIAGQYLMPLLLSRGVPVHEAERMVADAGLDWRPRTSEDRWASAAAGMFDDGFTPEDVRRAIASLVREKVSAA